MSAKIEREKVLYFSHTSDMPDVGKYEKSFLVKRRTPGLDAQFITTKAALTGGLTPLTRGEMQLVDTLATLNVYFQPIDSKGKPISDEDWIDDIFDNEILFALHRQWVEYQNSFYPKGKQDEVKTAEATSQA